MRRLLRRRHSARQALQVTLHTGRRALELREVFLGQTIEPERADLVTKLLVHRMLSLLPRCSFVPGNGTHRPILHLARLPARLTVRRPAVLLWRARQARAPATPPAIRP